MTCETENDHFVKDTKKMRAVKRDFTSAHHDPWALSHMRENVHVCELCAVRCSIYTHRRLQGNRYCLWAKILEKLFTNLRSMFAPVWRRPPVGWFPPCCRRGQWFSRRMPNPANLGINLLLFGFLKWLIWTLSNLEAWRNCRNFVTSFRV